MVVQVQQHITGISLVVAATAMKMKKSSCGFVCGDDFAGGTEIKMGSYCDT